MSDVKLLQEQYVELYGNQPATRWKNDEAWLRKNIDEALENGVTEEDEVEGVNPPKSASKERKEAAQSDVKIPEVVQQVADDIGAQNLVGKFYTGDGMGGNWEMTSDKDGVSIKKLS